VKIRPEQSNLRLVRRPRFSAGLIDVGTKSVIKYDAIQSRLAVIDDWEYASSKDILFICFGYAFLCNPRTSVKPVFEEVLIPFLALKAQCKYSSHSSSAHQRV
jgi:hypothetical protein